jgi:hypothetical protein
VGQLTAKAVSFSGAVLVPVVHLDTKSHVESTDHAASRVDPIRSHMFSARSFFAFVQGRMTVVAQKSPTDNFCLGRTDAVGPTGWRHLALGRAVDFCDARIIPAWHGTLVPLGALDISSRLFVKHAQQCFIRGVVFQMVDLVSSGKEVCNGGRRRLVGNGAANDVGHVPMIFFGGDFQLRRRIETTECSQVHVASQDRDPDTELFRGVLQSQDELLPLFLVMPRRVMVVQVVQKINLAVKLVEEASREAKPFVEEFDWRNDGRL